MRMLPTRNGVGLMLILAASASCGGSVPPAPGGPTGPTPPPAAMLLTPRCLQPVHPGDTAYTACFVGVEGEYSRPVSALADLRQFGGPAEARLVPCPACGATEFDMEVHVPADMPLGPQKVPVWAIDANGQRADATALIQVTAR